MPLAIARKDGESSVAQSYIYADIVANSGLFVQSKAGQRIAVKMLNRVAVLLDAPDGSPEATACDIA